jgi:20S proteasome subunit beta 4
LEAGLVRSVRPQDADTVNRYYCLSLLDKHHHPDITLERGMELLTLCADELKRRLPIDFKGLVVKAVTKDGVVDMPFDDDRIVKSA